MAGENARVEIRNQVCLYVDVYVEHIHQHRGAAMLMYMFNIYINIEADSMEFKRIHRNSQEFACGFVGSCVRGSLSGSCG